MPWLLAIEIGSYMLPVNKEQGLLAHHVAVYWLFEKHAFPQPQPIYTYVQMLSVFF